MPQSGNNGTGASVTGPSQGSACDLTELLAILPTAVYVCDADGMIETFNPSAARLWGREPHCADPAERYCGALRLYGSDGAFIPHAECPMARVLHGGYAEINQELTIERLDGSRRVVMVNIAARRNAAGMLTGAVNCMTDITDRKVAEQRIRYLAHYDPLTGLPSRTLLHDRLQQEISHANRHASQVAVLVLDLDHFGHANQTQGHARGDRLLQTVAVRLRECLREGDSVAHLGGDGFVLTTPLVHGNRDAALVAQKLLAALAPPIVIQDTIVQIGASIGISLYPNDGLDADSLIGAADTAMVHAKERGRGNYQFFTAVLDRAAHLQHDMEIDLRGALARDELEVHFQPQVDLRSGSICAAEALLRWRRVQQPPLPCSEFIAIAEQSGLIVPIGEWVLRQACVEARQWRQQSAADVRVAVNLSARQFLHKDLLAMVKRTLEETGLPASALSLEINESVLMERGRESVAILKKINTLGVALLIDDFGTGNASLAHLQRFPVQALKIDRSFIHGVDTDGSDTAMVRAIIAMAHSLDLKVLAGGVENARQAEVLLGCKCCEAQGYFYSKAVPAPVFTQLLGAGFAPMRAAWLD
ncbi:MAG: EAL domain-containing protein [Herminiimonas sp.]|nr:EAL domain-containing protein [Herminiimonas sp.]